MPYEFRVMCRVLRRDGSGRDAGAPRSATLTPSSCVTISRLRRETRRCASAPGRSSDPTDREATPSSSGRGSGRSKILIDDHEVAALPAQAESYDIMAALFSDALGEGYVRLRAGKPVRIAIEMVCQPGLYHVLRFGCRPPEPPDLLDRAIAAARAANVVVLMVGTNQDIETESQDRDTTSLPGPQDELVERVLDANPSTAIIVNAGRAIDLPWASKASTILYSWLSGHAYGPALAAVLARDLEPGGRLPITIAAARTATQRTTRSRIVMASCTTATPTSWATAASTRPAPSRRSASAMASATPTSPTSG